MPVTPITDGNVAETFLKVPKIEVALTRCYFI